MSEFTIPIIGNLISSLAAEFRDEVKPMPGSVLRCDLGLGANFLGGRLCHTGIYLGGDKIAEVTNIRGRAKVMVVDPYDFLHGQGTNFLRTGINIYVATDGCGNALGSPEIAKRARSFARRSSCGEYDLVENNCHKFTVRCVTGVTPSAAKLTDRDVANALKRTFGCERITWERTGASSVNFSFDD